MSKQYNYCLDFIKGLACIFVVFMHCEFPGILGIGVQAISRFCVPLFFMVSGYYCYRNTQTSFTDRKKKVRHILKITVNAAIFYILFAFAQNKIWGDVSLSVTWDRIIPFLCCNQMFIIVSQMWFLFALLYVYVVYMLVGESSWFKKYSITITVICLILYVCLAQGFHTVGIKIPNFAYKNWLIEGLGFFTLGYVIHQHQTAIVINNSVLISVFFLFTALSLLERFMLGRDFGVNICSIPQVIALFLYAINNPDHHKGKIQQLGKKCSMYIYILHPFVWHSLERTYNAFHIDRNTIALYIMPIFVLFITTLLSILFHYSQLKLKLIEI